MRKKQHVSKSSHLDEFFSDKEKLNGPFGSSYSLELDQPTPPAFCLDEEGNTTLLDGTPVVEPVPVELKPLTERSTAKEIISSRSSRLFHPGALDVVKCTVCSTKLYPGCILKMHPALKVLICKRCEKFYTEQKFVKDAAGKDENCRWCGDGGDLICCDTCANAFCKRCIKRNLGRSLLHSIESLDDSEQWRCFACDPTAIESLQMKCSQIMGDLAELESTSKSRRHTSKTHFLLSGKMSSALKKPSEPVGSSFADSVPPVASLPVFNPACPPCTLQTISDTSAPSTLTQLLQLLGQTLAPLTPLTDTAAVTYPIDPPSSIPLGRQTSLHPGAIVSRTAVAPVNFKELTSNFDASVILNQINCVNSGNVQTAIKATRRCIDLFSSDLRLLEAKLTKASSDVELASLVRSFHSLYRFHLFARFANLAHRMREELPEGIQGGSGLVNMKQGPISHSLPIVQPSSFPLTIDLTDDGPKSSTSDTPISRDKSHARTANRLKSKNDRWLKNMEQSGVPAVNRNSPTSSPSEHARDIVQVKNGLCDAIHTDNPGTCPSPPTKRRRVELQAATSSDNSSVGLPDRLITVSDDETSNFIPSNSSLLTNSHKEERIGAQNEFIASQALANSHCCTPSSPHSQSNGAADMVCQLTPAFDNDDSGSFSLSKDNTDVSAHATTVRNDVDGMTKGLLTNPIPLQESAVFLEDIRSRLGDKSVVMLDDAFQQDCSTLISSCDTNITGEHSSTRVTLQEGFDQEIAELSAQVFSLERACNILEKRVSKNDDTVVPQSTAHHTKEKSSLHKREGQQSDGLLDQTSQPIEDELQDDQSPPSVDCDNTVKGDEDKGFSLRSALLAEAESDLRSNVNYRAQLLQSSSDEAEAKADDFAATDSSGGPCSPHHTRDIQLKREVSSDHSSCSCTSKSSAVKKYHGVPSKLMKSPQTDDHARSHEGFLHGASDVSCADLTDVKFKPESKSYNKTNRKHSTDLFHFDSSSSSDESTRQKNKSETEKCKTTAQRTQRSTSCSSTSGESTKGSRINRQKAENRSVINLDTSESPHSDCGNQKPSGENQATKRGRRKPRRRRVVISGDSSGGDSKTKQTHSTSPNGSDAPASSDSDSGGDHKGRREIRRILKLSRLSETTKSAEAEERERRRRIAERQRRYNEFIVQEGSGADVVTTKLILEMSPDNSVPIVQVHSEIVKQLKPHQVDAVRFLWDCVIESVERQQAPSNKHSGGAILAHCMGLGKTLSLIAFVHTLLTHRELLDINRCLVICPVNTLFNWKQEWEMWLPEDDPLDVFELVSKGNFKHRIDVLNHWFRKGGILLIGYDMFRNFVGMQNRKVRNKSMKEAINGALIDPGPDVVVCDEGHVLKNIKSGLSKAVSQIRTLKRIILTGTPLQNNLSEYHAMVNFVKPNLLGTAKEFNNRFVNPIKNGQHSNSTERDVNLMKKRAHVLYKTLDGCIQRKDYNALTKYLPPRYEYVIMCRLSQVQRDFYKYFLQTRADRLAASSQLRVEETGVDRRKTLFSDQQTLYRVWTHPYLLRSHETREARKMLLEDDDELTDTSNESSSSAESEAEELSSSESAISDCEISPKSVGKGQRPSTRSRITRSSRGNFDDVINLESDSSDKQPDETSLKDAQCQPNPWWYKLYKEEYDWSVEVGCKLEVFLRILKKCNDIGDKMLIFTQSLLSLDLLERFLGEIHRQWLIHEGETVDCVTEDGSGARPDVSAYFSDLGENTWVRGLDYERLDGSMNAVVRKQMQHRFNHPTNTRLRLFLISTRAGGLGINLIAANRLVLFDASWNPSHDVQSIFRSYRFGQTKPAYIYRLIAQGTMEEKIYDRQVTKQSLSLRVIDEQQVGRHFSDADLQALFVFDPDIWNPNEIDKRPTPKLPKDRLLADMLSEFPHLIVSYHEHDSLLEHREDEGLSELERQEAWREYEDEKKYGMSLAQYQRLLQQQEMAAQNQQHQALNWRMLQQQQQQQQQQLLLQHFQQPWRSNSGPLIPNSAVRSSYPFISPFPRPSAVPSSQMRMGPGSSPLTQTYEKYRAHLLMTRPNLASDPVQLEKMVVSQMMNQMTKNVRTTLPVPMSHLSSPSTSQPKPSST